MHVNVFGEMPAGGGLCEKLFGKIEARETLCLRFPEKTSWLFSVSVDECQYVEELRIEVPVRFPESRSGLLPERVAPAIRVLDMVKVEARGRDLWITPLPSSSELKPNPYRYRYLASAG
jgi:hypothetical protein